MRINLRVFTLAALVLCLLLCLPAFGQSTRSSNSTNASTQITDASLEYLSTLQKAELIVVSRTLVTNEGIEGLRKALPNTTIRR